MPGRRVGLNILVFFLLLGAFAAGVYLRLRFKPGPAGINPEAKIDPLKHYTLTFWDFDRPPAGGADLYRVELAAAVREFGRLYPNATVRVELLPWGEGEELLKEALRQGEPPDVLASGPLLGWEFGPLLVPCAPYLTAEELEGYSPVAREGAGRGGTLVVWPRWLSFPLWAGNAKLLAAAGVNPARIQAESWSWEEFTRAAEALKQLSGSPFLFTSYSLASLWRELGRGDLATPNASPWAAKRVRAAAERAQAFWQQGAVPYRIGSDGYAGLEDFFTGRAAVFGPVEPWFLRAVAERRERVERGLLEPGAPPFPVILLPPAGLNEGGVLPVWQENLLVFRQRRYRGDDHTRLAMELARHLSRTAGQLAARLDVVPAWRPAQEEWRQAWPFAQGDVVLTWLERGAPAGDPAAEEQARARLEPLLQKFWEGGLSPGELAAGCSS